MNRIFYEDNGKIKISDCRLVKDNDVKIYHINNDNVKAIEYHPDENNNSNMLLQDDTIREITVHHFREKEHQYEQYIVGRGNYTNTSEFSLYGEINDFIEHKWDNTNIRFDESTVITGLNKPKNCWEWIVNSSSSGKSVTVHKDGSISDFFGGNKCVVVGSDEPIESVELFKEIG